MNQTMSLADLFATLADYRLVVLIALLAAPLLAWIIARTYRKRRARWLLYGASVLAYGNILPGLMTALLIGYLVLIANVNAFTDIDLLLMVGPVASGLASLILLQRHIALRDIPGLDSFWGLCLLALLAFVVLLLVSKLRILVGFFGSFLGLVVLFVGLYWLFHFAARLLGFGQRNHN